MGALKVHGGINFPSSAPPLELVWLYAPFSSLSEIAQILRSYRAPPQTVSRENLDYLCQNDNLDKALLHLQRRHTSPSDSDYISLLKVCIRKKTVSHAKQVYANVASHRSELTGVLGDYLVITLAKCGDMEAAFQAFQALNHRTLSSWSAIISGYEDCGKSQQSLNMYNTMLSDGMEPDCYAYVSLFKACGNIRDLDAGRKLHEEIKRRGLTSNIFITNTILSMYGKCASLEEAEILFEEMCPRNAISWSAMLSGYVEQKQGRKALLLYRQMREEGLEPNALSFLLTIQACCLKKSPDGDEDLDAAVFLDVGRALHVDAARKGFTLDFLVASTLLCMYGKYGKLAEAEGVFSTLPEYNIVTWTTMVKRYVEQGQGDKALQLYRKMIEQGLTPDQQAYVILFQACCSLAEEEEVIEGRPLKTRSLEIGRALHEAARERGFAVDAFVGGTIVTMYGKCGSIIDAENVFMGLPHEDVVSWNVMMCAYVDQGFGNKALILYREMMEAGIVLDDRIAVTALQACVACLEEGEESSLSKVKLELIGQMVHMDVSKFGFISNGFVGNTLINFYSKCGSLLEAENVFLSLNKCNVATWNVMLCAYLDQGQGENASYLYSQMQEEGISPDERTFVIVLQACNTLIDREGSMMSIQEKREGFLDVIVAFHADARKRKLLSHVFVANSLITSYAKCGALDVAEKIFVELPRRSVVSWNAILSAYLEQGKGKMVLQLYTHMHKEGTHPDQKTFVAALQASCSLKEKQIDVTSVNKPCISLCICKALHADAEKKQLTSNIFLGNTLIRTYGKYGRLKEAVDVFDGLCHRNTVSWNAMLSGFAEQGRGEEALELFREMQGDRVVVNDITLVCICQACSETGDIEVCREIHFAAACSGLDRSTFVGTTLVHAYGCCAGMSDCETVFDGLVHPVVESWNALLTGFAGEGNVMASCLFLEEMYCRSGQPSHVTFCALLLACSHIGLVERGIECFIAMDRDFQFHPELKHYVILVDLLGRAGDFNKVENMLAKMPVCPDIAFWSCLLSACRVHGNIQFGTEAFNHALQLHPNNASLYVSMSNIFADARRIVYVDSFKESGCVQEGIS